MQVIIPMASIPFADKVARSILNVSVATRMASLICGNIACAEIVMTMAALQDIRLWLRHAWELGMYDTRAKQLL